MVSDECHESVSIWLVILKSFIFVILCIFLQISSPYILESLSQKTRTIPEVL